MPLFSALEIWVGLVAASTATLGAGIVAGRSTRGWQRALLLIAEIPLAGAVLVLVMFEIWFLAKWLLTPGLSAAVSLLAGIVVGIGLSALAGYVAALLIFGGYAIAGSKSTFSFDLRNSLWISRGYSWRPRDFTRG